jgi:MFS family permease
MTMVIPLTALAVCVSSALRSTWSPCGLSMLSTLTPMTERARGRRYRSTVVWFVGGAVVGGVCLGGLMAGLAAVVDGLGPSRRWVGAFAIVACLLVAASDLGVPRLRLPVHYRQVNERWLDEFRPWVYGAGFGWQLGTGLATYITTGGVYLLIALGASTGRPLLALALGAAFGMARGLAILAGRRISDPDAMRALHRRLASLEPASRRLVVATALACAACLSVLVVPMRSEVVDTDVAALAVGVTGVGVWAAVTVATATRQVAASR